MSDLAELYAVFIVLYWFESLAWVPRRTVGFFALAGRWRARAAFRPNASWSLSVVLGKPWPPLTPPWLAEPLPFAVDPRGLTLTESDKRRLTWEELPPFSARANHVDCGELLSFTLASHQGAASLAEAMEKARLASPKKREAELRKMLDARFDVEAPTARRRQFERSVLLLRWFSNALWLALFGGLGVAVFTQNMLFLLATAALTLLLWPINSLLFWRTLRKQTWLPRPLWPDRGKRLVAILSPLSSVRAADLLAREAWANLEPLVVAVTLLPADHLLKFARPLLIAVQPREQSGNHDDLAWWRTELRLRMERVLASRDITTASLLAPPLREGDHVWSYCPACHAQYEAGRQVGEPCPNDTCRDIPLRAFADEGKRAPASDARGTP